jgi:sortase A
MKVRGRRLGTAFFFLYTISPGVLLPDLPASPLPASSGAAKHSEARKIVPMGRIEITRIGLVAPILEGTDADTLKHAVGHFPRTPLPGRTGNVALAAHRDTFFKPLRDIRKGDEITLTTADGCYRYRVDSTQVVKPENVEVLDPTPEPILTLVTCYPFNLRGEHAPERFIVRAHKI